MKRRSRRRQASGQVLIIFALGFALFLFGVTSLVADTAFLFRWSDQVLAAAQLAAQSGADAVDPRFLYGDVACASPHPNQPCSAPIVDTSPQNTRRGLYAFQRACIQAGDQSAQIPRHRPDDITAKNVDDVQTPEGTACDTDGCRVFAEVVRSVDLPIPIPGFASRIAVRGRFFAAPVVGSITPHTVCTGAAWVPTTPP
jgi:hypothetical protein